MIPEREREALMRLTMCAREECRICKYEDTCNFTFQCDLATENMNILADALGRTDTPQTESTGSPIGDYRDGVGAWQTDCDDRYAIRTDSGEVVAHACPLGCEQTDCGWK